MPDEATADIEALPPSEDLTWRLVRTAGRAPEVVAFDESVVAFFLDFAGILGIPKSYAVIYGICFASPEPLSFSQIQDRLSISAGSISQGIKVLREVGALKAVRAELDRREHFVPDLELRKLLDRFLNNRISDQLRSSNARLRLISKGLTTNHFDHSQPLHDRIKHLQNWHSKASALIPLVRAFLELKLR